VRQAFLNTRRKFGEYKKTVTPARGETVNPLNNPSANEEKNMRKTLSIIVLVLALCCPISAGIIHNPAPAPTPASVVQESADDATLNGEMATPGIMHNPGVSDVLAEAALDLLAVLPTLL
jgi:hypothetical protein